MVIVDTSLKAPQSPYPCFQVCLTRLNTKWTSSLGVGVIGHPPDRLHLPVSLAHLKKDAWVILGDRVYKNGIVTDSR